MSRTTVISVCTLEHADVWFHTSHLLPEFLQADDFVVYVPDAQLDVFTSLTNGLIQVKPEDELGGPFRAILTESLDRAKNLKRFGWYYQQFLKIQALLEANTEHVVIWDADAVPLRRQHLFGPGGQPIYARANEHHAPYFAAIERLLGMERIQQQSFIVPGFPLPKLWLEEWVSHVEELHGGKKWFECLIDTIDFRLNAGFSEFETLGTWVSHKHPADFRRVDLNWLRTGQSTLGYAKNTSTGWLLDYGKNHDLDVVSFESWDFPGLKGRIRKLKMAMDLRLNNSMMLLESPKQT